MKTAYLLVHHVGSQQFASSTIIGCYTTPELRAIARRGVEATISEKEDLEDVDIEVEGE